MSRVHLINFTVILPACFALLVLNTWSGESVKVGLPETCQRGTKTIAQMAVWPVSSVTVKNTQQSGRPTNNAKDLNSRPIGWSHAQAIRFPNVILSRVSRDLAVPWNGERSFQRVLPECLWIGEGYMTTMDARGRTPHNQPKISTRPKQTNSSCSLRSLGGSEQSGPDKGSLIHFVAYLSCDR